VRKQNWYPLSTEHQPASTLLWCLLSAAPHEQAAEVSVTLAGLQRSPVPLN